MLVVSCWSDSLGFESKIEKRFLVQGSEEKLMQSADLAVLLTNSTANGGIGGQVDGVDPIRNPGKFRCAWISKNYKSAFVHEIGHLFGARDQIYYHILLFVFEKPTIILHIKTDMFMVSYILIR